MARDSISSISQLSRPTGLGTDSGVCFLPSQEGDHMKRSFVLAGGAIAALCLLLAPVQVQAQSFTASLQGTVKDSTGAVVQGARLTLVNEATNVRQEKLSDSHGLYLFTLLPPGTYKLTVDTPGFQTSVRSGMVLQVQQQAEVDIVLSVGDVA